MFELSMTWWKIKDYPDPDQTAWWDEPLPDAARFTPRRVVDKLLEVFNDRLVKDAEYKGGDNHTVVCGIERPGMPRPNPYVPPADRPFLAFGGGQYVTAMRLRLVMAYDRGGEYHGVNNDIQKALGLETFGMSDKYAHSAAWLAEKLDASVLWRDNHWAMFCFPGMPQAPVEGVWCNPETMEKTDMEKDLMKMFDDFLPEYFVKKAIASRL